MRVLFLDFDGVLNSHGFLRDHRGEDEPLLDPCCMAHLRDIIEQTDARIVLTTSWRRHWSAEKTALGDIGQHIDNTFAEYGLTVFDKTPDEHTRREENIRAYLTAHPDITTYAVLDDAFLEADIVEGHFVRTSSLRGGLNADAAQATIGLLTPLDAVADEHEALEAALEAAVTAEDDGRQLRLRFFRFFDEDDLCVTIHRADDAWYLHDGGAALRQLSRRVTDAPTRQRMLRAVCDDGWIVDGAVTGWMSQERQFFDYLKKLTAVAHADLIADHAEEPLFPFEEEDAYIPPDRAEEADTAALLKALRALVTVGFDVRVGSYVACRHTYAPQSTTYSYRLETVGERVRWSDRCQGMVEGEMLENFYWDHEELAGFTAFAEPFLRRFDAVIENGNFYRYADREDTITALFAFFQLAHLVSGWGYTVALPS